MTEIAIVTGAGRGIGKAIAENLARRGYHVVLGARSEQEIDQVATGIRDMGGKASPMRVDVGSEAELETFVDAAGKFGAIAVLVNNAGIAPKPRDGKRTPLIDMKTSEWDEVMRVNLTSAFVLTRDVGRRMCEARSGVIVNISSIAIRNGGLTAGAHYVASKSGMIGLTKAAAKEFAPFGVRVNAVAPGRISTAMTVTSNRLLDPEWIAREVLLGREGAPKEIADAVEFLVTEKSSYITGMTLDVTGGWSMP